MAKKVSKKRRIQPQQKQTNWLLIGGVIGIGVIGLFALLFLSLQGPTEEENLLLQTYCENNLDNCITRGNVDAPVTIVEVSDYNCPHCRTFNMETAPLIDEQYVKSGQVRYISLPYALPDRNGNYPSLPNAVAALCANEQSGYFEDFQRLMFEQQSNPLFDTQEGFIQAAEALGMDVGAFSSCLANNDYEATTLSNIQIAQKASVTGTPTFFINGRELVGPQPFAVFQSQINALLGS
jgi:protein-disulfide isomerase